MSFFNLKLLKLVAVSLSIQHIVSCSVNKVELNPEPITYKQFRAKQKAFDSSEGTLKYIEKGRGEVVVLLHGVPSSGWLYRKMIDDIADAGYRVIVPDMLGYGSSDSPDGYALYSAENHAKRLLALMDSLGVKKWTQVCHDAGGMWTWEMVKQDPKRLKKLVVLNSVIYAQGFHPPIRMDRGLIAKTSMWMYRNGVTTNMLLGQLFKAGVNQPKSIGPVAKNGYKKPMLEGKTKGMYHFFTQTCNELPNYRSTLESLDVPTMVVWGRNDKMLRWLDQSALVKKDLDENLQTKDIHLVDAKHFIQEEKPEQMSQLIIDFLKR